MFAGGAHQRGQPQLFEANARFYLRRLTKKYGRTVRLGSVPYEDWRVLAGLGFDLVWLMGVWRRSAGARERALMYPYLLQEYEKALPGCTRSDVAGSPYAVCVYELAPALGAPVELAQVKADLNRSGMGLIVDFVPNHVALDHPWVLSHPEWFVRASDSEVRAHPDWYFRPSKDVCVAHGRDPNFPPWTDTAQVNLFSAGLRAALIGELVKLARLADGVRCDMAMLALNEVFERVWGGHTHVGPRLALEFWSEAIAAMRRVRPDFLFIAESYWGYDRKLLELGFNYAYDKDLYDLLKSSDASHVREHLAGAANYLKQSVHFIDNHDEARAITAFGRERSLAAAAVIATLPGMRFYHEGQLEGRTIRVPVQLVREPDEPVDDRVRAFYERLLRITAAPVFRQGAWQMETLSPAREGNSSHDNLLAWCWTRYNDISLAVINYSNSPAQGWLHSPPVPKTGDRVIFLDELNEKAYMRERQEITERGLYIALEPYQAHIFRVLAR